nr:CDP-alcohol phosphatidyltransferase family protein [Actinoplanes regularis]
MRRGGTLARQALLVRVGRRNTETSRAATAVRAEVLYTGPEPALSHIIPTPGVPLNASAPFQEEQVPTTIPLLPGEHTMARRARFALVNACTLASLGLGLLAIFLAMEGEPKAAAGCLVACVVFDGLDGALARKLGVASPFGAQMDSLADMSSFGLAAPVVVYASLVAHQVPHAAAALACALVAGCAAIRLARFNVSPKDGRFFCGVPTTMAAAVLALAVLIDLPLPGMVVLAGVALLAFAMVSSFPYAKLARILRLPPWLWLLPVVGALVLEPQMMFVLVVATYLVSGPILWVRAKRA